MPSAPMTPTTRSPTDVLRNAVAAAVMAPSTHNTQPWRFRISGSTLEVLTDQTRHLHVIDGERRQQVQSCGCALFNARVAVRTMGFEDEVTVMFADGQHPAHVASLHLGASHPASELDHVLMGAIGKRRTNRRAFLPRPVASAITEAFAEAAAREGATMVRLEPGHKKQLAQLIDHADRIQYGDPAFRKELAHWLTARGSLRKDGIPFVEKEYGSGMPFAVMRSLRSPTLGDEVGKIEDELVNGAPVVIVLGTAGDDAADWLACGQALQAVLLHATSLGLSAAFLNQVLEIPGSRGRVAELVPTVGYPHMVLRIGVPAEPVQHVAPRRSLDDVLTIVA
ncbi:nitroreductase family protein [soil metagenome]